MKRLIILITFTLTLLLGSYKVSFGQLNTRYEVNITTPLNFGNIAPAINGTIQIYANAPGLPNCSAGTLTYGGTSRAEYTINRIKNTTVITGITATPANQANGGMNLTSLTVYPLVNASNTVTLNKNSPQSFTFYVGGILNLGASPVAGIYSGNVTITITSTP